MTKWLPINKMVLIRKDEDKQTTTSGIILPEQSKIPVITGRVLEIGPKVDPIECPIRQYDRVLVNPQNSVPISFESNNKLYLINSDDILAHEEITTEDELKTVMDEIND